MPIIPSDLPRGAESRPFPAFPSAGKRTRDKRSREFRLYPAITRRSESPTWEEARREWDLEKVLPEALDQCACWHRITKRFLVVNHLTGNRVVLGSCCVKTLLDGLGAGSAFESIERVLKDPEKAALNEAAVDYAHSRGLIDEWQAGFYRDINRIAKRYRLRPKQLAKRVEINRRVVGRLSVSAGRGVR
jgi:hypothetical protein